ncbi:MAG: chorismate synthase [Planctomycetes bacterium]|nr:chorismate synthase [Planctomycetota bacterium]
MRWTTAGESHGAALVGIVEGVPAGLALSIERVDGELARRQGGYGRGGRMKLERDRIELLSGTRGGITLGSPIAFVIRNNDAVIEKLPVPTNPRPGHADLAGCQKFGHRDPRAVLERASARETATRVACAGIARQVLEHFGIEVFGHVVELGGVAIPATAIDAAFALSSAKRHELREKSAFFALDAATDEQLKALVDATKEKGDTLGGIFEVRALGLPPGLGGYASGAERLTARLGAALLSIPAMKGVEFGLGFATARVPGSLAHDAIQAARDTSSGSRYERATNRAGGLEGGMTTGEPLVVRTAMKPIPTLRRGLPTVEFETLEPTAATYQRSDVTSVPAASVVGEAMVALELTAAFLEKFGGDSLAEVEDAVGAYRRRLGGV